MNDAISRALSDDLGSDDRARSRGAADTGAPVSSSELTFFDVLLVLKKNSRHLALVTLLAGVVTFGITWLITPKFTAEVSFIPPQQQSGGLAGLLDSTGLGGLASMAGSALGGKSQGEMWVAFTKSRSVEDALVQRFDLKKRYKVEFNFKARQKLEGRTTITLGKDGVIHIEVDDTDPGMSAKMANAYIEELQKLNDRLAVTEAGQRRMFFEQQFKLANEQLVKAEAALSGGGVGENLLKASPEAAADIVGQLKAHEVTAQVRVNVLATRVTPNSPEMLDAVRELESVRAQLATAMNAPHAGSAPANAASAAAPGANGGNEDYINRFRDFKYAETLFEMITKELELAKVDEAKEGTLVQVVDRATVPEWKSSPKRAIITLVVAVLVFALAFVRLLVLRNLAESRAVSPALENSLQALRTSRWFR